MTITRLLPILGKAFLSFHPKLPNNQDNQLNNSESSTLQITPFRPVVFSHLHPVV